MSSEHATDADLWALACAGDDRAVAALYDRHADRLHAYCYRRTGRLDVAQDLASTVWLEAWRGRRRVRASEDGCLAPWLFGIANNVLRNSARSQRRHRAALDRLPRVETQPDHADLVAQRLDDRRRMTEVLDAVGRLPAHQQDVLALSAWADLDQAQIALALGVSVGTVKSRLSRARAALRALDGQPSEPVPPALPSSTRRRT